MGPDNKGATVGGNHGSPSRVEATEKSLAILAQLKEEGPATLTEVAEELGHSKSTVHRHLATLEAGGLVTRGEDGFRIGLVFLDYGVYAQREHPLYRAGRAKIDDIAEQVEEKAWLMTEENGYGVFIYHQQGRDVFRTYTRVGYRGHLHAFAAGKAILAHLPPDRVDDIIDQRGLPAYTSETTTDRAALDAELEAVRERGVSFNRQESINGVNAVAAPVLVGDRQPLGSICVAGPASRLSGAYFDEELPELLLGVANEIEVRLEYS